MRAIDVVLKLEGQVLTPHAIPLTRYGSCREIYHNENYSEGSQLAVSSS